VIEQNVSSLFLTTRLSLRSLCSVQVPRYHIIDRYKGPATCAIFRLSSIYKTETYWLDKTQHTHSTEVNKDTTAFPKFVSIKSCAVG
jgi:hypothetical protein